MLSICFHLLIFVTERKACMKYPHIHLNTTLRKVDGIGMLLTSVLLQRYFKLFFFIPKQRTKTWVENCTDTVHQGIYRRYNIMYKSHIFTQFSQLITFKIVVWSFCLLKVFQKDISSVELTIQWTTCTSVTHSWLQNDMALYTLVSDEGLFPQGLWMGCVW